MRHVSQQLVSLPEGPGPLHFKLYQKVRSLIVSGAWVPGTRLPSSRQLSRDLGISRNTAVLALDQLIADGWITARPGSGTYVSDEAPPARPTAAATDWHRSPELGEQGPTPFQMSPAAVDIFPVSRWSRLVSQVWTNATSTALQEGAGAGWLPLRSAIAAHLNAVRGLSCTPEQVLVLSSSQAAIDLAFRVLARPGEKVWTEDPGYPTARRALRTAGLVEVPVPVDSEGVRVADGVERAPEAKIAYVTPACQFPTTAIMSRARRAELLDWAGRRRSFILEDDWDYNSCSHPGQPAEPLAAREPDRVLFIHSFNRLMFPGLRIAALVVPRPLLSSLVEVRESIDGFTNVANQVALAAFIEEGHLAAHLRACRAAFAERGAALRAALSTHAGRHLELEPTEAGLHCLALTGELPDAPLAAWIRRSGLACSALSDFAVGESGARGALLLGYAAFPPAQLAEAARRLASSIDRFAEQAG